MIRYVDMPKLLPVLNCNLDQPKQMLNVTKNSIKTTIKTLVCKLHLKFGSTVTGIPTVVRLVSSR